MPETEKSFIARHSLKPKGGILESKNYPGLSEAGVELAEKRAGKEIWELIEASEPESIVFIAGATRAPRTASTAEVYGEKLKELAKKTEDVLVITRSEINSIIEEERSKTGKGWKGAVEKVVNEINKNPDKRIVIDFPFFFQRISLEKTGWVDKDGEDTPYAVELYRRNDDDEYKSMIDFIENKGKIGELKGVEPEEIAKAYDQSIAQLREFAGRYIKDRPIIVGLIGHGGDIETYLAYLLSNRKNVTVENFEKITQGELINETELTQIKISSDQINVIYRGRNFKAEKNEQ